MTTDATSRTTPFSVAETEARVMNAAQLPRLGNTRIPKKAIVRATGSTQPTASPHEPASTPLTMSVNCAYDRSRAITLLIVADLPYVTPPWRQSAG